MKQQLNNSEACRLVGIHRSTGQRWRHGRRLRNKGREYYYRPITAPPPRASARFLSEDERVRIADLHRLGWSTRVIARKLGRDPSTISRELRRNADPVTGSYRPFTAHRRERFDRLAAAAGLSRITFHDLRHSYATGALKAGISPKVVSQRIGHANVGFFLQTYAHVLGNDDQDAAEQAAAFLIGDQWDLSKDTLR
jgi:integrase